MKNLLATKIMPVCLALATLTLLGAASAVQAAAPPALNGELFIRPLTPTEISTYGIAGTNVASGGLSTVAIGEPVYLDALVNLSIAPANIQTVTWSLVTTNGSAGTLFPSPLGTNVPVYNPADKLTYQVAGRALFRPSASGTFTINATISATGSGTTNVSVNITAGIYLGVQTCASCHGGSGEFPEIPSIYPEYTNTAHATAFMRGINGQISSHFSQNCENCHVLGYDTNSFAINSGFINWADLLNWTFPATLNSNNWANMPSELQGLANIQCENCHGAGSEHILSQGISGNTNAITVDFGAGDCTQCHDDLPTHYYAAEWYNSLHAQMTRTPSGSSKRIACVRCHTAMGFVEYLDNLGSNVPYATNYNYEAVTCQACHDPHNATNPDQLRTGTTFTLSDGTTVTNAGLGGFCFNCHNSRNGSVTNSIVNFPQLAVTWNGGSSFGPHDSPQADMLEGVNGYNYGEVIPSSPHASVVSNTCVGCHMQTIASTDPAFTLAGGHSTKMSYTNSVGAKVDVTYVCAQCHGAITNFNFPVADYDGDGVIEGVQTEVQNLLNDLSALLPYTNYVASGNYPPAGFVQTSISPQTNWAPAQLEGAYNWQFVNSDGSLGVHNLAYTVGLLKASIANLTGVSVAGGLPDAWVIHYFGSITNPAAGPDVINNASGMPNWMMYALGLSPNATFKVGNSGVIYFDGNTVVNGSTNAIAIYTAAEIAFNTTVGESYQIQGISSLTSGWTDISTNIPGTGASISYVTPTRNNAQMFFRVVQTP
jgi:nitrate reductase cytochrome c-type subunit